MSNLMRERRDSRRERYRERVERKREELKRAREESERKRDESKKERELKRSGSSQSRANELREQIKREQNKAESERLKSELRKELGGPERKDVVKFYKDRDLRRGSKSVPFNPKSTNKTIQTSTKNKDKPTRSIFGTPLESSSPNISNDNLTNVMFARQDDPLSTLNIQRQRLQEREKQRQLVLNSEKDPFSPERRQLEKIKQDFQNSRGFRIAENIRKFGEQTRKKQDDVTAYLSKQFENLASGLVETPARLIATAKSIPIDLQIKKKAISMGETGRKALLKSEKQRLGDVKKTLESAVKDPSTYVFAFAGALGNVGKSGSFSRVSVQNVKTIKNLPKTNSVAKPNTIFYNQKTGTLRVSDNLGKVRSVGRVKNLQKPNVPKIRTALKKINKINKKKVEAQKTLRKALRGDKKARRKIQIKEQIKAIEKTDKAIQKARLKSIKDKKKLELEAKKLGFKDAKELREFQRLNEIIDFVPKKSVKTAIRAQKKLDRLTKKVQKRLLKRQKKITLKPTTKTKKMRPKSRIKRSDSGKLRVRKTKKKKKDIFDRVEERLEKKVQAIRKAEQKKIDVLKRKSERAEARAKKEGFLSAKEKAQFELLKKKSMSADELTRRRLQAIEKLSIKPKRLKQIQQNLQKIVSEADRSILELRKLKSKIAKRKSKQAKARAKETNELLKKAENVEVIPKSNRKLSKINPEIKKLLKRKKLTPDESQKLAEAFEKRLSWKSKAPQNLPKKANPATKTVRGSTGTTQTIQVVKTAKPKKVGRASSKKIFSKLKSNPKPATYIQNLALGGVLSKLGRNSNIDVKITNLRGQTIDLRRITKLPTDQKYNIEVNLKEDTVIKPKFAQDIQNILKSSSFQTLQSLTNLPPKGSTSRKSSAKPKPPREALPKKFKLEKQIKFVKKPKGKTTKGYRAEVKVRGKWRPASKVDTLNRVTNQALLGADSTSSASVRIVRADKPIKPKTDVKLSSKFTKFRKSRRTKNVLVEKRSKRIDTRGEKRGITFKGIKASKKKGAPKRFKSKSKRIAKKKR